MGPTEQKVNYLIQAAEPAMPHVPNVGASDATESAVIDMGRRIKALQEIATELAREVDNLRGS